MTDADWPADIPRRLDIDEWWAMHGPDYPFVRIWCGAEEIGKDCVAFDADMGWARVLAYNSDGNVIGERLVNGKITIEKRDNDDDGRR